MRRGEVYRSDSAEPERGGKPDYYVVVSRSFIAEHERIETVVCAPVYSEVLGIPTEVVIDAFHGVRHHSAIRRSSWDRASPAWQSSRTVTRRSRWTCR